MDWGVRRGMLEISIVLSRMVSCECKASDRGRMGLELGGTKLLAMGWSNLVEKCGQNVIQSEA